MSCAGIIGCNKRGAYFKEMYNNVGNYGVCHALELSGCYINKELTVLHMYSTVTISYKINVHVAINIVCCS